MLVFLFLVPVAFEGLADGVLLGAGGVADCAGVGNDGSGGVVSSGTGAGVWDLEGGGFDNDEGVVIVSGALVSVFLLSLLSLFFIST